jgi:hypothetical protein
MPRSIESDIITGTGYVPSPDPESVFHGKVEQALNLKPVVKLVILASGVIYACNLPGYIPEPIEEDRTELPSGEEGVGGVPEGVVQNNNVKVIDLTTDYEPEPITFHEGVVRRFIVNEENQVLLTIGEIMASGLYNRIDNPEGENILTELPSLVSKSEVDFSSPRIFQIELNGEEVISVDKDINSGDLKLNLNGDDGESFTIRYPELSDQNIPPELEFVLVSPEIDNYIVLRIIQDSDGAFQVRAETPVTD